MKVEVTLGAGRPATDATWVGPLAPEGARCEPDALTGLFDLGELAELTCHDVLDAYAAEDVDRVLSHWLSLLRHGGRLTLSVVDLGEVARGFASGGLSVDAANELLHGGPRPRRCSMHMEQLCSVLRNRGMRVLRAGFEDYRAVITCERP